MNAIALQGEGLLRALRAVLSEVTGVDFEGVLRSRADAALESLCARAQIRNPASLGRMLRTEPETFDKLMSEVMVGETYFFREPAQLDFMRDVILPERVARGLGAHAPRVWCAGCSTGEEAYTLAIVLREAGYGKGAQVLATDISAAALQCARAATFRAWSFRDAGVRVRGEYGRTDGDKVTLMEALRRSVDFKLLNLMDPAEAMWEAGAHSLDLIFCRNVLVYFEPEPRARVFAKLFSCLAPGGWLITAASDPMPPAGAGFATVSGSLGVFFQRPLETASVSIEMGCDAPVAAGEGVDLGAALAEQALPPCTQPAWPSDILVPPSAQSRADEAASAASGPNPSAAPASPATPPAFASPASPLSLALSEIRTIANRDPVAAAAACQGARARFPASAEVLLLESAVAAERGDLALAERALRALLFLDHDAIAGHLHLARILLRKRDAGAARKSLRNAQALLRNLPREAEIPLADGTTAGILAEAVDAELSRL